MVEVIGPPLMLYSRYILIAHMLRAAFLGYALVLLALLTAAAQGQFDFGSDDPISEHGQTPLTHDYQLTCETIAMSISPASQVFYPGVVPFPSPML
jgi:hypothetical protein